MTVVYSQHVYRKHYKGGLDVSIQNRVTDSE